MEHFYNTIGETGRELQQSERKARTQEERILRFFHSFPRQAFTPFEVLSRVAWEHEPPITSVRRALTNLVSAGVLEKMTSKKRERYGKQNHRWRLAGGQLEFQL